jgi:hypothetical protein
MSDTVDKIVSTLNEITNHKTKLSEFVGNIVKINEKISEMFEDKNNVKKLLQSAHEFDGLIKKNKHEHMVNIIKNGSNDWRYFMINFSNFTKNIPDNVHTLDTMITHVHNELPHLLNTLKIVHTYISKMEIKDNADNKISFKFNEMQIKYVETTNVHDIVTSKIEEYEENNKNINTRGQEIAKTVGMLITDAFTEDILTRISLLKLTHYRPEVLAKHEFIKKLKGELKGGAINNITITNMSKVISIFEDINIKFFEINVGLKKYKENYDMYIKNHNDNVYYMLYMQSVVKKTTEYPKLIPLHIISIMSDEINDMIEKLKLINPINNHINERYGIVINTIKQFLDTVKTKIKSKHVEEMMPQKTKEETMPEKTYEDTPHEEMKEEIKPNNLIDVFKCDIKSQYMFNVVYQFRKIIKDYNEKQKIEK